jgi:hypothetical protein
VEGIVHEQYLDLYYSILGHDNRIATFLQSEVTGNDGLMPMAKWLQRLCRRRLAFVWLAYSAAIEKVAGKGHGSSFANRQALRLFAEARSEHGDSGNHVSSVENGRRLYG